MPALWWVELCLVSLVGKAMSRSGCETRMILGSLIGRAVFLSCFLFVLRLSSTGDFRLLGGALGSIAGQADWGAPWSSSHISLPLLTDCDILCSQ